MSGPTSNQNLQRWGSDVTVFKNYKNDSDILPEVEKYWIREKKAKIAF